MLQPAPHRVPQWSSRLRHRQPLSPAAECRRASHWALPERLWSATGPRAGEQRRGRTRPWKRAGWQLSGRDAQRGSGPADGALSWRALLACSRGALSWRALVARSRGARGRGCARARATPRLSSRWKRTGGRRTGSASTTGRASPQAAGCAPPASPSGPFCSSSRYVLLTRRHGVRLALTLSLEWRARVADGATAPPACAAAATAPPRPSPPAQQPRRRPSACGGHQQRAALDARAPRRRDHPAAVRAGQARPGQGQGKGKGKG